MPPTLEKKKSKAKRKGEPIPDFISKAGRIKQKQEQTVIVNINKQKRGERERSSIEKPKVQKEQPKTINQFSFSMPSTQNPIGDYIKMFNTDLYAKIERAIKTKDPVINSLDEPVAISRQAVKELKRIPTVLETIPPPTTLDNFIKNQEELSKPIVIGEPTALTDVTTLDDPESLSLDEEPEEPEETKSEETVETLKKVEPTTDLFKELAKPTGSISTQTEPLSPKRNESPIQLGVPVPTPIIEKKRGRPPLSEEEKALREIEREATRRPVGRPAGTKNEIRGRLDNRFTEEASKPAPQRRASLNLGRPIGTSM